MSNCLLSVLKEVANGWLCEGKAANTGQKRPSHWLGIKGKPVRTIDCKSLANNEICLERNKGDYSGNRPTLSVCPFVLLRQQDNAGREQLKLIQNEIYPSVSPPVQPKLWLIRGTKKQNKAKEKKKKGDLGAAEMPDCLLAGSWRHKIKSDICLMISQLWVLSGKKQEDLCNHRLETPI